MRMPSKTGSESTDAPYFVDLVNDWLLDQFQSYDFQNSAYRVYTTLDSRSDTVAPLSL